MKLIKRPNIVYHISCCGNCFYNSSIYAEAPNLAICQKLLEPIDNEKLILAKCPLEDDHTKTANGYSLVEFFDGRDDQ